MAALMVIAFAFAPSDVAAQSDDDVAKEVTVVGCVQREKNYHKERRRVDSGPFMLSGYLIRSIKDANKNSGDTRAP